MAVLLVLPWSRGVCRADRGDGKLLVYVSILPQRYFVEKIGGSRLRVFPMVLPGANPATYEPKPRQMAQLRKAKVYFAVGVPFENVWLERIASANPDMTIVHSDAGIEKRNMATRFSLGDASIAKDRSKALSEGRPEPGQTTGKDPHTWLSPPLAKIHARNIKDALVAVDPAFRKGYEANYQKLERKIDALHDRLKSIFSQLGSQRAFMVFHPAWGYFADTYGLRQIPVELEGKPVKMAHLQRLIHWARTHHVRVLFVQKQFPTKSAQMIARAINGKVVYVDPLSPRWAENLLRTARQFREALR